MAPLIVLVLMLGWLYRHEIVDLVASQLEGIDFPRRPAEEVRSGRSGGRITEGDRKELERILRDQ